MAVCNPIIVLRMSVFPGKSFSAPTDFMMSAICDKQCVSGLTNGTGVITFDAAAESVIGYSLSLRRSVRGRSEESEDAGLLSRRRIAILLYFNPAYIIPTFSRSV